MLNEIKWIKVEQVSKLILVSGSIWVHKTSLSPKYYTYHLKGLFLSFQKLLKLNRRKSTKRGPDPLIK